jgi:hypothetical protein
VPTNLANDAAVIAAGYAKTTCDRGTSFETTYSKHMAGYASGNNIVATATGYSTVSAAAADTQAVAALNGWRNHRYGFDATARSLGPFGTAMTVDVS